MTAPAHWTPLALRTALVVLAALAALSCGLLAPPAAPAAAKRLVKPSALPAFPSCKSLLSYARRNARLTGGRTGVPTRAGVLQAQVLEGPVQADVVTAMPTAPAADSPSASPSPPARESAGAGAPEFSQTNVQEAGVDEPDIIKTDGRTVFTVADAKLHAVDVTATRRGSSARSASTARTAISCCCAATACSS